ncbi:TagK domain-containing protein [Ralstonia sp. 25C]|uniref:TagK domain-containing protein n=1 Tax=Ralstonia sp. 25C TaxID=3447363 RepID=UPI003F754783
MRSFRLPWRRQPEAAHIEPVLRDGPGRSTVNIPESSLRAREASGDGAVLSLIGVGSIDSAASNARTPAPAPTGDADSADGLVDALHAQYWRALADPHASLTGSWAPQVDEPSTHAATHDAPDEWHAQDAHRESASIEALLSGERTLDDVFGRLEGDPVLEETSVPEVLRLFAPPEFHAADTRWVPALPPALTRREHHALSVDSPLAAPSRENDA